MGSTYLNGTENKIGVVMDIGYFTLKPVLVCFQSPNDPA